MKYLRISWEIRRCWGGGEALLRPSPSFLDRYLKTTWTVFFHRGYLLHVTDPFIGIRPPYKNSPSYISFLLFPALLLLSYSLLLLSIFSVSSSPPPFFFYPPSLSFCIPPIIFFIPLSFFLYLSHFFSHCSPSFLDLPFSLFFLSFLCRLHTAFLHWPLSSAATKEVQGRGRPLEMLPTLSPIFLPACPKIRSW